MRFYFLGHLLASAGSLYAGTAGAMQTAGVSELDKGASSAAVRTQSYDAAFFAKFAPRTALDMVRQVPGFQLDSGDSDVRGLSGSAGNLVINGSRPSSKSEGLETVLSRIPAASVIRIEIGSGDRYGADYAGKGQVINLTLSATSGINGDVTAKLYSDYSGRLEPDLSASAVIKRGQASLNLSAGTDRYIFLEEGYDRFTALPGDTLLEFRDKVNTIDERAPFVSVAGALEQGPGRSIHINARYASSLFALHQDNRVSVVGGPERDDELDQRYLLKALELGGDISRPMIGGTVKLVGLATRRKRNNADAYRFQSLGRAEVLGGFRQQNLSNAEESVARFSFAKPRLFGLTFEAGGEIAFNKLTSDVQFFSVAQGGAETRIDLPIDQATVSELRGEAFVTLGRPLTPRLRLDVGLRSERSKLKVRGDTRADRSLSFLKPNATLDWQARGKWHGQLSVKRSVAQLDFFDFISSAELSSDRVNGGNADLEPQRAWELRGSMERPLFGDGQARIELGYDRVSKLQDRILTPLGFDAPGNIGSGTNIFAAVTIDAPLDRVWTGLRIKADALVRRTRVEDPITGEQRDFSGGSYPAWRWSADLRRDRGAFAYGVTVSDRAVTSQFRSDEVQRNFNVGPYGSAFIEYRPDGRTKATLNVENIFNTAGVADRLRFDPDRRPGSTRSRDYRFRNNHVRLALTLARTFSSGTKGGSVTAK